MICTDPRAARLGAEARRARRREGPVIVAASSIATWHWCPLKAWHDTTLFNTGWLTPSQAARHADALASLWAAQLTRGRKPAVRRGRLIHGDHWGEELETLDPCSIPELGVLGLIDPQRYREQVKRLREARDPVEYYQREEWPLYTYETRDYVIAGVPDGVEHGEKGVIIYELKTTRNPHAFLQGKGLQAALHQLAAYTLAISTRWNVEKAILEVRDHRGRRAATLTYTPNQLEQYQENAKRIAKTLASDTPPPKPRNPPCKTCEYNQKPVHCDTLEALLDAQEY